MEAEACHQIREMKSCPMHSMADLHPQDDKEKKGCCDDETQYCKDNPEQQAQSPEFDFQNSSTTPGALVLKLCAEWLGIDKQTIHYLNYKPPLLVCDFSVSLQTFRL